jgi:hypothetical protein
MQLYLEREFIDDFWDLDLKNEFVIDFYDELIDKSRGYNLYTNFSEQEFYNKKEDALVRAISEGSERVSFNYSKKDFFYNKETMHKLILDKNNNENKQTGNQFECISSNNLIKKWKRYSPKKKFTEVPCTKDNSIPDEEKFSEWEDLKHFCRHPLNEIIIYDKYILKDNYHASIKNNLLPMLDQFKKMSSQSLKIKIITLPNQIIPTINGNQNNIRLTTKVKEIKNRIREKIKECRIDILVLNKENEHIQHDRWVYTNLFFIYRGAGFNIFNGYRKIDESSEISFKFIFLSKFNSTFRIRRKIIDKIINSSSKIE